VTVTPSGSKCANSVTTRMSCSSARSKIRCMTTGSAATSRNANGTSLQTARNLSKSLRSGFTGARSAARPGLMKKLSRTVATGVIEYQIKGQIFRQFFGKDIPWPQWTYIRSYTL
jgi:hypothetical protein